MRASQESHYKERNPGETVAYLQNLLRKAGVETEEQLVPKSSIDTYSMRINLRGTELGANGKGVTEAYMRASGYAELVERLQNGHINPWGWYQKHPRGFWHCPDERQLSSAEISQLAGEQSFLQYYFTYKGWMDLSAEERAERFEKLHRVEYQFGHERDSYEARPFL